MTKPKAVAQAVTAKKRMPSLLRSANNRIHKRSSSSEPRRHVLDIPPITSFDADPKTLAQISDLTEPLYDLKRDPPVHEVHSAYQSAASSLTQPSALEKARRSFSSDPDIDHPKYSNLIYPESPKAFMKKKLLDLNEGAGAPLSGPTLHALDKLAIQKSDSSDTLSQQYVIKKRSLVVGIPVESAESGYEQDTSNRTDIAIADNTVTKPVMSPTTEESVVFAGSKLGGAKPARKIGFKAVKALINRVHSGSPRKRYSPSKASKKNSLPSTTTELSQRDQALLLASSSNVEETVSGIPVILEDSTRRPGNRAVLSYRDHDLRLEPPDLTRTKSSNDPSPKNASFFDDDDGPPDLTETMSSADMSVELHSPANDKLLEPPELQVVEPPRPGSPELRRGDVSPVLAKDSRRRGLEPEAVVGFGERTPVDAPVNTVPHGRLSIVGIPVDSDEVLSRMGTRPEMEPVDEARQSAINAINENHDVADDPSITQSIASRTQQPFDSSNDGSVPMSARVARARRASKPINPFDSSSEDSSNWKNGPKTGHNVERNTNPFELSSDSGEMDDPFDRILLENQLDSLSDDGIPPPYTYMSAVPNESQNKQVRNDGPSPLRDHNYGNQSPPPQRKVAQKAIPTQSLDLNESSLTLTDQDQPQKSAPVNRFPKIGKQGADSDMATNKNAAKDSPRKFSKPLESVALADSISEWSGNHSEESGTVNVQANALRPHQVMGQIVADDDELKFPGRPLNEAKSFLDKTPKVSNEAKNSEFPKKKMLSLGRVQHLGPNSKPSTEASDVGVDPSGSRRNIKSVQAAHSPVSLTKDHNDRYHFRDAADEREDVLDQFFTFIGQTIKLTPKTKRSVDRSIDKLKPEAKLIVEAAVEKAKHAESTEGGLDQFYQDGDIELAFQNISESSVQSIKQLMVDHKRMPILKIKQLGASIASIGRDVDASEASELLSELQDFSSVVKGAAKRSLKKSQSAGGQAPKWTKELIDLTGVDSFGDLDDEEAIWLFDQNSSPRTPRSDLESLMDFAAKRLGLALDPEIVLTAASKTKSQISSVPVGALSPQTNVSDSPFAAIRNDNSHSPPFNFDKDITEENATTNKVVVEDVCYDPCRYAEAVLCGETGIGATNYQTVIEKSASNESNQGADKYDVSNQADKYSKALDDKLFEDKLSEDQFNAADLVVPASTKLTDQESDLSSSDGLSVILAKIKRDIQNTEDTRNSERRHMESDRDKESQSLPPDTTKPPNRRDFLDVLFEATGSFLCGAVDVGSHSMYGGARKKSKRKKSKKKPATDFSDDQEDPFSGLELESPSADDSPSEAKSKLNENAFVNSFPSANTHPPKPINHLIDITSEARDRREHLAHNHAMNQKEAKPEEENETTSQLDVDVFESTGSLLNKGPFSPIDEQPSAEEEYDFLSFRPERSPSTYREIVGNDHGSTDSSKQADADDDGVVPNAAFDQSVLDVTKVDDVTNRNCENASEEDLDVAASLEDASDQTDLDEPVTTEVDEANRTNGGLSPKDVSETDQLVNDDGHDLPYQSNGPKPEDFHLHGRNVNFKPHGREPPIPEVFERGFLGERSTSSHSIGGVPDDSKHLGLRVSHSIEVEPIKVHDASSGGNAADNNDKYISRNVGTFPKEHGSSEEQFPRVPYESKVVIDRAPNQIKVPPTPEGIKGFQVGYRSDYVEKPIEEPKKTSISQTNVPPTPEGVNYLHTGHLSVYAEKLVEDVFNHSEEKSPPPAPEIKRPVLSDVSTSKVSIIRSKFENPPAATTWDNFEKAKPKSQDVRSPDTRFSRISSLRSKFEKRVSGTKDDGATGLKLMEEPSFALELDRLETSIDRNEKKEDFPDLIDLTSTGSQSLAEENGMESGGHQLVDAVISEKPIGAVLSRKSIQAVLPGEGIRPESPIIVDEGIHDVYRSDDNSQELRPFSQIEYLDLISLKENRNSLGTWVSEDGRSSDIAFSLSPSTTASNRVLQTYTQHHLFDALPVLAASSSSGGQDVQHDKPFERRGIQNPAKVHKPNDIVKQLQQLSLFDDGYSGSQSSEGVSISSTNVEGAKHCDSDPNTIPDEIAVNIRSTQRSLLEKPQLSINLPWDDDDSDESSGDESASLLLALTRSEVESEVIDTCDTTPTNGALVVPCIENNGTRTSLQTKGEKQLRFGEGIIIRSDDVSRDGSALLRTRAYVTTARETEKKAQTNFRERSYAPTDHVPVDDVSNDSARLRLPTIATTGKISKDKAHATLIEGSHTPPDHVAMSNQEWDVESTEGSARLRNRTPSTIEQDSLPRKVSSPLFSSIKKRLSKNKGESGTMPQPIDAEKLFATLDRSIHSVIDVTSYNSLPDNERTDRELSTSETSEGIASSETSIRPNKLKTNHFLETIMDRLRVSPSAQRFTPKSNIRKSSPTITAKVRSSESASGDSSNKKESSDVDELFQRYDEIVKNMVVLDEERLARVQAKQMASIVMAADSAVDHVPHSPQALSEIARRLRRTAAERKKEDKGLAYRNETAETPGEDTTVALGSVSAASDSTHPSSYARQLRRDLQAALDKSSAIRSSQLKLGEDMTNLQVRLQERRSLSPSRTRSLPYSPIKSFYHRNCAVPTDTTSDLSPLNKVKEIPRTILTKTTDMTSEDEDIQNRHLESIRSGLRSSVEQSSPRGKARRRRFRRSE